MPTIAEILSQELGQKLQYVENVIALMDEGNTIPFIARYRKEMHGTMDDTTLRNLETRLTYLRNLQERRDEVKNSIENQGKMTEELSAAIDAAATLAEVEDLYQEVLINLWKSYPSFERRSSLRTWIWRVSLNTCISIDRKKRRRKDVMPLNLDINLYTDTDSDTKQIKLLHERINRLGVFDRAIILLWLENMSYEEIGAIVGISEKNVSVRLVRIREQLKNMK